MSQKPQDGLFCQQCPYKLRVDDLENSKSAFEAFLAGMKRNSPKENIESPDSAEAAKNNKSSFQFPDIADVAKEVGAWIKLFGEEKVTHYDVIKQTYRIVVGNKKR